jgi:hypothetical protein
MEKKQRLQLGITAVLVLVLIFAWANSFKVLKKRAVPQAQQAVSGTSMGAKDVPDTAAAQVPQPAVTEEAQDKSEYLRDPFSGKIYTGKEAATGPVTLKLDGIIWDEKAPLAMINGRILKPGDTIAQNRIIKIKPDRVFLSDGLREFELKLR